MNKLYYIVCDDKDNPVFEGRYQGRTRAGALKFLKQTIGRKTLNGLVFTITEIPVPLIREIVAEILAGGDFNAQGGNVASVIHTESEASPERYDAFANAVATEAEAEDFPADEAIAQPPSPDSHNKVGNPGLGDDFWADVRAFWESCRSNKQTATQFGISPNTLKTRIRREGWNK